MKILHKYSNMMIIFFDRRHFSKTLVSVHQSKGGSTDTFQLNWFTKATGRCNQSFWNFRAIGRPVASLSLRPVNLEAWGHIMSCKQVGVTFFYNLTYRFNIFFSPELVLSVMDLFLGVEISSFFLVMTFILVSWELDDLEFCLALRRTVNLKT